MANSNFETTTRNLFPEVRQALNLLCSLETKLRSPSSQEEIWCPTEPCKSFKSRWWLLRAKMSSGICSLAQVVHSETLRGDAQRLDIHESSKRWNLQVIQRPICYVHTATGYILHWFENDLERWSDHLGKHWEGERISEEEDHAIARRFYPNHIIHLQLVAYITTSLSSTSPFGPTCQPLSTR